MVRGPLERNDSTGKRRAGRVKARSFAGMSNKIKERLSFFNLNQKDLGLLLGHKSTTYISELINGVCPFTLRDLTIIHEVLE